MRYQNVELHNVCDIIENDGNGEPSAHGAVMNQSQWRFSIPDRTRSTSGHISVLSMCCVLLFGCASTPPATGDLRPPKGYANMALLGAALAVGAIELVDTEPPIPDSIVEYRSIEYRTSDGVSLSLDLFMPKEFDDEIPLLVFIHGGSWRGGDKRDYLRYLVDYAVKGYATATISYRLMQQAKFPAAVTDISCALSWLRRNSEAYGFDPDRIALVGGSAGGHLAMMVVYSDETFASCGAIPHGAIRGVVNFYGPSDLITDFARNHRTVEGFLGTTIDAQPDVFELASPITHIDPGDPPTLVFHGTIDDTVPVEQSDLLAERLIAAGVPVEYHRLRGWPHTMDAAVRVNAYCQFYMDRFFAEVFGLQ